MTVFSVRGAASVLVISAFLLPGCDQIDVSNKSGNTSTAVRPANAGQACLVDGAEKFEVLTENAATMAMDQLMVSAAATVANAGACKVYLSVSQTEELESTFVRVKHFDSDRNRTLLALGAVEAYRVLVSAQSRDVNDVPVEVALLDYAGFRYQAGAHSVPPMWGDMKLAVEFADEQWRRISSRVADKSAINAFSAGLDAMRNALDSMDAVAARTAAMAMLDQVDVLESAFSKH